MVSKLVFKGERKKGMKKSSRAQETFQESEEKKTDTRIFAINGDELKLSDIDLNAITNGWTTAFPIDFQTASSSIINVESGKLPIILTYADASRTLCLKKSKYTSLDNASIKARLEFSEDFDLSSIENTIIYTASAVSVKDKINRIEPSDVNQVFMLSDVSTLFKSSAKIIDDSLAQGGINSKNPVYSIKIADGEYLTFDPTCNELKLSMTLTQNGLFTFSFEIDEGISQCRILVGTRDESNTLLVTKKGDIKVIPDPDDLLGPLSRFVIRIRKQDAYQTKEIIKAAKEKEMNNKSPVNETGGKVGKTAVELSKLGFKVNDKTLREISKAHAEGRINQWIVDFKEKTVHDRRV